MVPKIIEPWRFDCNQNGLDDFKGNEICLRLYGCRTSRNKAAMMLHNQSTESVDGAVASNSASRNDWD